MHHCRDSQTDTASALARCDSTIGQPVPANGLLIVTASVILFSEREPAASPYKHFLLGHTRLTRARMLELIQPVRFSDILWSQRAVVACHVPSCSKTDRVSADTTGESERASSSRPPFSTISPTKTLEKPRTTVRIEGDTV